MVVGGGEEGRDREMVVVVARFIGLQGSGSRPSRAAVWRVLSKLQGLHLPAVLAVRSFSRSAVRSIALSAAVRITANLVFLSTQTHVHMSESNSRPSRQTLGAEWRGRRRHADEQMNCITLTSAYHVMWLAVRCFPPGRTVGILVSRC